jgi:hypothetical protein
MNVLKIGIPKGSLENNTVDLFKRAGWRISYDSRSYFPDIDDPEITCTLVRAQEMSRYVEDGHLDMGLTGIDWILENSSDVVVVQDLVYSKVSTRQARWVDFDRDYKTMDLSYMESVMWAFKTLWDKGLVYEGFRVLAYCWRCETPVTRRDLEQWFFRITRYADELMRHDGLDWPESIKLSQRNWIGRSEGARVRFRIADCGLRMGEDAGIEVFTTRPDTLFGATYMVLSPEHKLVDEITTPEQRDELSRPRTSQDLRWHQHARPRRGICRSAQTPPPS